MEDNSTYLIPRNVITRFEFFPGFGWFEIGSIAFGVLIALIFNWLLSFITESGIRFILYVFFPAVAFFMFKPTPDGQSFYKMLRSFKKWSVRKKRYLYSRRDNFYV